MTLPALLLFAFGFMGLGALLAGFPAYAHGRQRGRADLSLDADEARRILAGWATPERSLTQAPPPRSWAGPRALWHRGARLRLDRLFAGLWTEPISFARTPLLELCPASVPPVAVWEPAEPWQTPGQLVPGEGDVIAEPEATHWPWTVLPLEPGLGYGGRHAAEPDGPAVEVTGEFWEIVGSTLFEQGLLDVDATLALPCSHCEVGKIDHVGCVGCACPCKLTEVR